ncbi:trigger factor [Desulfurispora thermophila]|uniref:trigger factor n=1 Tax=Desulfurispora thermophila TaxID=265470 RepID=UPI00035CCB33|nr:trigger factor [Desulfurispora thermophila]
MKATAERIEKNTVVLEVEVEQSQFEQAVDRAYRKLVHKVSIPGFRKGKAPRVIFERFVGKEVLLNEAVELVVPDAYQQAVQDTGVEPVAPPELEVVQLEDGKPFVFKAKVVVKPEVKLGQYKGLEVSTPDVTVTDEDIENELKKLQNRYARLLTLEEGEVQNGDLVSIDFEGKIDGEPFAGGQANDYTLEIGSRTFIEGFEEQIVGMTVGETRDIKVRFPDDYGKEELAGKDAVFTVTVKLIKRKELSPLDDEFAKDVSEFDTLAELREDIANKLKEAAREKADAQVKQQVLEKAVAQAEMDIPEEMIAAQTEETMQNMETRLLNQGLSLDNYLQYTNSNRDELRARMREDVITSIKQNLVLEAVARAEGLEVSEAEVDAEINKMSERLRQDVAVVRKILEARGQMGAIKENLLREKALQFLADSAVYV